MNNILAFEPFLDPYAITDAVCEILLKIQVEYPTWIKLRYQHISLAEKQPYLHNKILELLVKKSDIRSTANTINLFFEKLLNSEAVRSVEYQTLLTTLPIPWEKLTGELISSSSPLSLAKDSTKSRQDHNPSSQASSNITLLLLDAENMDISETSETWLGSQCDYPVSLKFAFGNWTKLGSRDRELHQRGYHLFHVPEGKNQADSKMIVIGASIRLYQVNIHEVIVCSNDHDLEVLRNTLNFQGLSIAWVQRNKEVLTLSHNHTKEICTFQIPTSPKIPAQSDGVLFLKKYIEENQDGIIPLGHLGKVFSQEFKHSLSTFVKHHQLGSNPQDFLSRHLDFQVALQADGKQPLISLQPSEMLISPAQVSSQGQAKTFTEKTFKMVIIGIAKRILMENNLETVSVTTLASTFHQQYDQSMKAVLKLLEKQQNIPKFLESCEGLKVQKVNKQWIVTLNKQKIWG